MRKIPRFFDGGESAIGTSPPSQMTNIHRSLCLPKQIPFPSKEKTFTESALNPENLFCMNMNKDRRTWLHRLTMCHCTCGFCIIKEVVKLWAHVLCTTLNTQSIVLSSDVVSVQSVFGLVYFFAPIVRWFDLLDDVLCNVYKCMCNSIILYLYLFIMYGHKCEFLLSKWWS